MADSRSVIITLKLAKEKEADVENQTNTRNISSDGDNDAKAKAAYANMALNSLTIVVGEVAQWTEYYWNKKLVLSDDYIAQRNKQIITTQINRAVGAMSNVAHFAMVGAAAGPVGAIIGAAIGTAVSVSQIARSNIQGQEQQDIRIRQMDTQLNYTRSRAGWSLRAASIGEDL